MRYCWLSALSFIIAADLAYCATPPTSWHDVRVKHTWNAVPDNWESLGHPAAGTTIDLYVALKPHQESALIDALYEVSDPNHSRYGDHLSKDQVAELVRPDPDALELVSSWFEHHGVRPSSVSTTHGGAWLTVTDVLVSQANDLLGASYQLYRHAKMNSTIIRTVSYAIPTALYTYIQAVAPTTCFASTRVLRQTTHKHSFRTAASQAEVEPGKLVMLPSSRDKVQNTEIIPSDLHWLYKTFGYTPVATVKNALGVVGFIQDYPSRADLTKFMTKYYSDAKGAAFTVVPVNGGGYNPNIPTNEASTDVQYTSAMAYPTPSTFYSVGGGGEWADSGEPLPGDAYHEWLTFMLDLPKVPQTISISYGLAEQDFPPEYATAVCNLFAQLGVRGVSVLFPSGDDGVGPGSCKDASGNVQFIPEFPSSCPFVTSVGGTMDLETEIAAPLSGGGFSSYFLSPPYQRSAVSQFLQNLGDTYAGLYNPTGRAYPDIAAQALDFVIVVNGVGLLVSGTSCSTPTVAGIISLLNDYRILKRKAPLGFLNPWLYGNGISGLNDITSGSNPGCGTKGFSAIRGWDPVTGLGTPDFVKLQSTFKID